MAMRYPSNEVNERATEKPVHIPTVLAVGCSDALLARCWTALAHMGVMVRDCEPALLPTLLASPMPRSAEGRERLSGVRRGAARAPHRREKMPAQRRRRGAVVAARERHGRRDIDRRRERRRRDVHGGRERRGLLAWTGVARRVRGLG